MTININIGNPQGPAGAAGVAVAIAANTIVANNTNATANPTGITASAARELLEVPSDTELAALLSPLASVAYVGANFAAISHNHSADNITSGALAKARQHAQTPYKDEANTWAQAQTFTNLIQAPGGINVGAGNLTANAATFNGNVQVNADNIYGKSLLLTDSIRLASTLAAWSPGHVYAKDYDLVVAGHLGISFRTNTGNVYGGTEVARISHTGAATFNGTVTSTSTGKLGDFTVATLPSAASNAGYEANVTDSSVTTFGSTVAGSGSSRVKVYSNGTNWTVQAA